MLLGSIFAHRCDSIALRHVIGGTESGSESLLNKCEWKVFKILYFCHIWMDFHGDSNVCCIFLYGKKNSIFSCSLSLQVVVLFCLKLSLKIFQDSMWKTP